jgi:DNA-dependent RNA polymerase auxiliary subunit epsilon
MKTNTSVPSVTSVYTLKEAVLDAINTLKENVFSDHDVTAQVRKSVNDDEYTLPGLEAAAGSAFAYNVSHDSVKEVIDSVLNDGTLANLGLTNVNYDGAYRTFEFSTTTTTQNTATDTDADESDSPVSKRIAAYIDKQGGETTVRNLQRALHINGLTSKDLVELLEKLNYTVNVENEGFYSTYTVEA